MRRTTATLAAGAAALTLLLAGCGGSAANSAGDGTAANSSGAAAGGDKGTLTLGMTADIQGWNPATQPAFQSWPHEAIWDQLVKCDANGEPTPDVADTFEVTDGNKTFKAHIREGMKFSDGTPVDSAAVKASFEYFATEGSRQKDFEGMTITTPDAQNISFSWPEPKGPIMADVVCAPKIAPATWLSAGQFDSPVGSGPYLLDPAGTTTGSVYAFTKNPDNWDADQYPYDKLVVKVITSDTAAVSALTTDQIDATLVEQPSVEQVKASGLDIVGFQGATTRLLLTDHLGQSIQPIGDLKVRQAINMVFDKAGMAQSLFQGNAEPTAQVYREGSAAFIDGLQDPYPFDVDKAKALMAEAGYADGFSLQLPTMEGAGLEKLLPYVTQQLALLNIKVEQVPLSGANAITDLLSGKYPVVLWQLGNLGNSALQTYIESTPDGWWNLLHQPDDYVDSRWQQILTADTETSAKLQKEINQYLVDQAWFAPMVYTGNSFAYNPEKVSIPTESDQEALTPKLRDFQ